MDDNEKNLIKNVRKPVGELGSQVIDRMNKSHEQLAQWGVSHLSMSDEDIVLDIGCGGGVNLKRFSKTAKKVYGVDYSSMSVERSIELNQEEIYNGKVEVIEASVSRLPFDDDFFDVITGFETVYFWPDFINDLLEVKRVLKHDGLVFFCNEMVYEEEPSQKNQELIEFLDLNLFDEEKFKNAFDQVGFSDFKVFKTDSWICVLARKI